MIYYHPPTPNKITTAICHLPSYYAERYNKASQDAL